MHVGLITPSWPGAHTPNGIATAVRYLAEGLWQAGQDVTIIPMTLDAPCEDSFIVPLVPKRSFTIIERITNRLKDDGGFHGLFAKQLADTVQKAISDRGVEVIILEETQGWGGVVQRQVPIPVVLTLHGPSFLLRASESFGVSRSERLREKREAEAFRRCAGINAPSAHVLAATCARYGLSNVPQAVLPNSIPAQKAIDLNALNEKARRSLLFVGRVDRLKGVDILLEAFIRLVRGGTDGYLTVVGPDHGILQPDGSRMYMADATACLPAEIRQRIDYVGPRSKNELDDLRRRHAGAVITSRFENLNYTLLESMALGLPTISTAVGGPGDMLKDGETALLVPPEDPEALAAAMKRLIDDTELAIALGNAAYREITRAYRPEIVAEQTVKFLSLVRDRWTAKAR